MAEGGPIVQMILGRRHVAVDIEALCEHVDLLVGPQVAEVIMNHHLVRLGKEDAEFVRKQNPSATPAEIVEKLAEHPRQSGIGDVKAKLNLSENGPELEISIGAPCITKTVGSGKSFLFSHWCGSLSVILGGDFEIKNVAYDAQNNIMSGKIVPHERPATQNK